MRSRLVASGVLSALALVAAGATPRAAQADDVTDIAPARPPSAASTASTTSSACGPLGALPAVRKASYLTVESPPRARKPGGKRMRAHSHLEGRVADRNLVWSGPEVPSFVPLAIGRMTLDLLDASSAGYMALYRDHDLGPDPMVSSCGIDDPSFGAAKKNCDTTIRLFDCAGNAVATVPLGRYMSRPDHLEVQDARWVDGTLYFNEACQGYSRNAGGRCSSLVAVDPIEKKILWRTAPLTSNNAFAIAGDYIVTAYGFTSEPSSIRLIRRRDGAVMDTRPLPSAADDDLTVRGDLVSVNLYDMLGRTELRLVGAQGASPKLVPITSPRRP